MPFPIYDTADAVPEAFRSEYEEKEGKWHPKVPDVTNLKSALDKEKERAASEEKARKAAEKERDDLKRAMDAKDKGISEEELQKIRDAEAQARKPLEDEITALKAANRKLALTERAKAIALANGVMPDRIEKAMKDLDGRLDLASDGTSIVVKDAKGSVTTETVDDFLKTTYKKEAPFFYAGSGNSGSGAEGSGGGGGGGSYDAVAAGKKAAEQQKKSAEQSKLAFQ